MTNTNNLTRNIARTKKSKKKKSRCDFSICLALRVGFEPTTARLTAGCSTAELTKLMGLLIKSIIIITILKPIVNGFSQYFLQTRKIFCPNLRKDCPEI